MSLLKFMARQSASVSSAQNAPPLHWQRAAMDGAPFRGSVPLLREDEFESKTGRVYDAHNGLFYTGDPEQNAKYVKIIDSAQNGWFTVIYIERWREPGDTRHYVYVEWVEAYIESGG